MDHWKVGNVCGVVCSVALLACPVTMFGQQVAPVVMWRGQVSDTTLQQAKPKNGIIASQEEFTKLWEAWMKGSDAPKVDFEEYRVIVDTSDKVVLSWHGYFRKEGEVKGLMGIEKDKKVNGFSYLIGVFKRDVVEAAEKQRPPKDDK